MKSLICIFVIFIVTLGTFVSGDLTAEEKVKILRKHNNYRKRVAAGRLQGQPMANDANELNWDDEIAAAAQSYADECKFSHDAERGNFGENLYKARLAKNGESYLDGMSDCGPSIKNIHTAQSVAKGLAKASVVTILN